MPEDLFPIADAKFHEDVGRDDTEYSAYMAGFRAGVEYERSRIHPDLIPVFHLARLWIAGNKIEKDELTQAMYRVVDYCTARPGGGPQCQSTSMT